MLNILLLFPFITFSKMEDDLKATFTLPPDILELITTNMVKNQLKSNKIPRFFRVN